MTNIYEILFFCFLTLFIGSKVYDEYKKKFLKKISETRFELLGKFFGAIEKYKENYSEGKITKEKIKELNEKLFEFTDEAKNIY